MKIIDNFEEMKLGKDIVEVITSLGINISKKLIITGKWDEFFDFSLPEEILYLKGSHSHEYIINDETPSQYISVECFDLTEFDTPLLMRGIFSVHYENSKSTQSKWFPHLRYEVFNDFTVRLVIRARDFHRKDSDPYTVLEFLESLNFKKKFETAIYQVSEFVEGYLDQDQEEKQ